MSAQHSGTYQYWKPSRKMTYAQWSSLALRLAAVATILIFGFAVVATVVMLATLPPEVPR